jgi:hypothetical protein
MSLNLGEDLTLPHRFLVLPPGIHVETWSPGGVQVEFLCIFWQGAQPNFCPIPPGVHLESRWTPWNPGGHHGIQVDSTHLLDARNFTFNLTPNPNLTRERATARRETRSLTLIPNPKP